MKIEEMQHLVPEPLREQFLAYVRLKTDAEKEEFREKSRKENAALSDAERTELQKAWLEGVEVIRQEVRAIGEEIKAAKTPA